MATLKAATLAADRPHRVRMERRRWRMESADRRASASHSATRPSSRRPHNLRPRPRRPSSPLPPRRPLRPRMRRWASNRLWATSRLLMLPSHPRQAVAVRLFNLICLPFHGPNREVGISLVHVVRSGSSFFRIIALYQLRANYLSSQGILFMWRHERTWDNV